MKTIKQFLVAMIATIALTASSCSNDNSDEKSPDSIGETEWIFDLAGSEFILYFSKETNQCHISQEGGNLIGAYSYSKSSGLMSFPKSAQNTTTGLFKTNTNYSITVSGNKLTVPVNGKNMIFTKIVD
ncbi:hypothetical protein [Flavobacterium piscis]|uniref:Lipocalin-like domain-containing protein n=1 Tax=Flavobacterium piscis TaxID=1114874 RepID=A0ABU1Y435_9FLAO|nr:hypothetical protein [Flavobacterium piscis]MDR7208420.1 hypothetical protein [Flavobacterium piscis]